MVNPSPKRVAVDVVVARAIRLDDGYFLIDQQIGGGRCPWHSIIAVHPETGIQLQDEHGPIFERYRPIIGE